MNRYPHTITLTISTDATRDDNGNWIPGSSSTVSIPCRWEPNASGRMIKAPDGSQIVFDGIIYAPLPFSPIKVGTSLTVKDGELEIASGTVKEFMVSRLNARIWL